MSPRLSPPRIRIPKRENLTRVESKQPDAKGYAPPVLTRPAKTHAQVIAGHDFVQHGGRGLCITAMDGRHTAEIIRSCWFDAQDNPWTDWLLRDYETQGDLEGCVFENVKKEHARYTKLAAGRTVVRDVLFRNIGSQAWQQRVDEKPESSYPDWKEEKQLFMRRVLMLECATAKGTRPAFALSPKSGGPAADFLGVELFIQTVNGPEFTYGGKTFASYGGACFELWRSVALFDLQLELDRPRNEGLQFFDYGAPFVRQVKQPDGSVQTVPGERRAPREIVIQGGAIHGCDVALRPAWHDRVEIAGVQGEGKIKLYAWSNGDWRLDRTLPLEGGYSQS